MTNLNSSTKMISFILSLFILSCMYYTTHAGKEPADFTACDGVDNLLGISEVYLYTKGLPLGFISSKVIHTPTITLDGPAFLTLTVGDATNFLTFFADF